jgi:thiol-disulfide isomerase/thioredoxin
MDASSELDSGELAEPRPDSGSPSGSGPGSKSSRVLLYAALAFVVFWIAYLTVFGPVQPAARLENSGMSQPAEYNWTVLDLEDQPVSFAKFKGKTVFLNFWATWCGPCVREMPSIDSLARDPKLAGKSIAFVCVSTDENSESVKQFLKGKNLAMTFLRVQNGKVPPVYFSEAIPATFVIAPDGRIAATQVGSANWHEPRVVEMLLGMNDKG